MDRAIPDHMAHIDEVLSDLFTADEEETLSALLRKLRDHLFDTNAEHGASPPRTPTSAPGPTEPVPAGWAGQRHVPISAVTGRRPGPGCRRGCPPPTRPAGHPTIGSIHSQRVRAAIRPLPGGHAAPAPGARP